MLLVGFFNVLSSFLVPVLLDFKYKPVIWLAETEVEINLANYMHPLLFSSFSCPSIYSAYFDVSHAI